jgi:DNA processing protein
MSSSIDLKSDSRASDRISAARRNRTRADARIANRGARDGLCGRPERIIEECAKKDIFIISIADEEFPERLREIKDAPPVLYVRGALSSLRMRGCAVVGTRQSSDTGECIAQRIAALLTKLNVVTVSGLALGIDAAAHKGALAANGITVAILAHGLHMISPTTNRKLAEDLVASGGALLAEHEPGVPPRPAEFVRRNRIQSGMSFCSIIVESGAVGGAIHQARFTREQGRPVFAVLPDLRSVPHRRFNSEGGEFLVREMKAIPLKAADELSTYLERLFQSGLTDSIPKTPLGL